MQRQKKTALGVTGLTLLFILLAAGLLTAGCEQATDPDPVPRGEGVLGQLYGVVVDSVTGEPLEGVDVTVALRDPPLSAVTDAKGAYLIKDVPPGTNHTLIYTKAGGAVKYRFHTVENVTVDPEQYKKDDPFAEYDVLKGQLPALLLSEAVATAGGTVNLSFTNGVWVTENGAGIQVADGVVTGVKLNYTYRFGQGLSVVRLAPLTGGIKGTIKLFKAVADMDALKSVKVQDAVPAASTEFWLKEEELNSKNTYGPFTTDATGLIDAKDLPVGTAMTLTTNGFFTSDGYFYKGLSLPYIFDGSAFTAIAADFFTPPQKGQAQLPPMYLFAEPDYALVTAFTAGTSAVPLAARNGEITLEFTKAIDPATFKADLVYDNGPSSGPSGTVPLLATWITATKVTLKGGQVSGGFIAGFPYSGNGSQPVGRLDISGKATDGSIIFAENGGDATKGLPVFTEEGLKAELDLAPTDIPPSRIAISGEAVKLTFNKAVDPNNASFKWGSNNADYKFADDKKSVFIWTDRLSTTGSGSTLFWVVCAAGDPRDVANSNTSETFTKAPVNQPLTLESTNIYNGRADRGPISSTTEANFPVNGNITLTFTRAIPTTAKVRAALKKSSVPSTFSDSLTLQSIAFSGKTVTIDPFVDLEANGTYYLRLEITDGMETLFDDNSLSTYSGMVIVGSSPSIQFGTFKPEDLQLAGTNIYVNRTDSGAITSNTEANFPKGSSIELTFTTAIPLTAKVHAALSTNTLYDTSQSISLTASHADKVVTIAPEVDLRANTQYYLLLEITDGLETLFSINDLSGYNRTLLYVDDNQNIQFKTGPGFASAQAAGYTSATSSEFYGVSPTGISGTSPYLKKGQEYYVQFDKTITLTPDFSSGRYEIVDGSGVVIANLDLEISKKSDRILSIKPIGSFTTSQYGVRLRYPIGSTTSGSINTSTGEFNITNLNIIP